MKECLTARWAMARLITDAPTDVLDPHLARMTAVKRALEMMLELAFRCMGHCDRISPSLLSFFSPLAAWLFPRVFDLRVDLPRAPRR
jgi:hypothetical protein